MIIGIRFSPVKVPGALVLVIGGLLASVLFDFEERGIALVGDVPRGFAAPKIPSPSFVIENLNTIGPAAIGLLLIGFSQTAGDARAFASKHGYRIDIDQYGRQSQEGNDLHCSGKCEIGRDHLITRLKFQSHHGDLQGIGSIRTWNHMLDI